jgi:predicted nucleic-acid-binding Zn-ribbon protein
MRLTQMCPKCSGKRFAVTAGFRQPDHYSSDSTCALPAITVALGPSPQEQSHQGRVSYGFFETWICLPCGYTEFYAYGLEGIEKIARDHPDQVRIVDSTSPEQGPYR